MEPNICASDRYPIHFSAPISLANFPACTNWVLMEFLVGTELIIASEMSGGTDAEDARANSPVARLHRVAKSYA
jgi:hypothetical protein